MKWIVGFLAVATILLSISALYFSYAVQMPALDELGIPPEDAPNMKMIAIYMAAKELIAIFTAGAALMYAFKHRARVTK
jgi:uncharacterized BrkB/YihY/UPF0761 family membrane protein